MKLEQKKSNVGIVASFVGLGALASAILSIIACLAAIGINPLAVFQPTPTPVQTAGELSQLDLEFGNNFGEYALRQPFLVSSNYSEAELQANGVIVHFVAKITGFKGQPCIVRWEVYNSAEKRLLLNSTSRYEIVLTADTDTDQASSFIWIASPGYTGTYYARLEIYAPNGMRLDYEDSDVFAVR